MTRLQNQAHLNCFDWGPVPFLHFADTYKYYYISDEKVCPILG